MKNNKNNVWIGTEQLNNKPELAQASQSEFMELPVAGETESMEVRMESNRRDFLKRSTGSGILICSSRTAFTYAANGKLNIAAIGVGG